MFDKLWYFINGTINICSTLWAWAHSNIKKILLKKIASFSFVHNYYSDGLSYILQCSVDKIGYYLVILSRWLYLPISKPFFFTSLPKLLFCKMLWYAYQSICDHYVMIEIPLLGMVTKLRWTSYCLLLHSQKQKT